MLALELLGPSEAVRADHLDLHDRRELGVLLGFRRRSLAVVGWLGAQAGFSIAQQHTRRVRMTRKLNLGLLVVAAAALGLAPGCSDNSGSTCKQTDLQAVAVEKACHGSAKSCSAIGISTESGMRACAYQEGCELSYDYNDCRGHATPCGELGEVDCGYQIGCTWEDGTGSSSGGSAGNGGGQVPGAPGSDPCASAGSGGQGGGASGGRGGGPGTSSGGSGLPGSGGAGVTSGGAAAGGGANPGTGGAGMTSGSGGAASPSGGSAGMASGSGGAANPSGGSGGMTSGSGGAANPSGGCGGASPPGGAGPGSGTGGGAPPSP